MMMMAIVQPGEDGIFAVRHGLGTERVIVRCFTRPDGDPVGYMAAVSLSPDEVEVMTVPGSGITAVTVETVGDDPPGIARPAG